MSLPLLTINGAPVHVLAGLSVQQTYTRAPGGETVLRLGGGAAIKQTNWSRQATTISAAGRMPPALEQVDWSATFTLGCVALKAIRGATTSITLPTARRTDAGPFGFAVLPDGLVAKTTISVTADVATLGAVVGAVAYVVQYYPLMTCYSTGPTQQTDATGTAVGWTLSAEEA